MKGGKGGAARSLVEPVEVTEPAEADATESEAGEEATEAPATGEGEEVELADSPAGKKEQVENLITKLKEINGFLNTMVTYWDETAAGGNKDIYYSHFYQLKL